MGPFPFGIVPTTSATAPNVGRTADYAPGYD